MKRQEVVDLVYRIRDELDEDNRKLNKKIIALADHLEVWFNCIPAGKEKIVVEPIISKVNKR